MIIGIMRVNSKQCAAREILYFGTIQEIELPYIVKGEDAVSPLVPKDQYHTTRTRGLLR